MGPVKFGTDGWRAIIDKDFTPENVALIAQAYANIHNKSEVAKKPVYIGYDRRAKSKESAELIASVLTANNITTFLSNEYCPTPTVSWMVKHNGAAVGVMITASHNPPIWNGVKFKESYGGSASPEFTNVVEEHIRALVSSNTKPKITPLKGNKYLKYFDPRTDYVEHLKTLVDMDLIKSAGFKCLIDPMYGSGVGYFPLLIGNMANEIHTKHDTNFGGIHPEPIQPHVNEAMEVMKSGKFNACIINDGDADRIGAVDEKGNYVTTHLLYSILLKHVADYKGWSGDVIKSISTTMMLNRLCKKYGFHLETTPVGFKYISPLLNRPGVLVGGEESGGIGFPVHVCERDGVLCGLLLLETMAVRKKTLGELVEETQKELGPCYYRRKDLKLTEEKMSEVRNFLANNKIAEIANMKVKVFTGMDGYHYLLEDDSWLLIRTSGTEPLMRIYSEAPSPKRVEEIHDFAKKLLKIEY